MFVRSRETSCPDSFPFPFQPYSIQDQFMRALYSVIEKRKIGVFESPTGTGKTLSLMCSTLKWLSDHNELNRTDLMERIRLMERDIKASQVENSKCDDWLNGQHDILLRKEQLNTLMGQLKAMDEYDRKVVEMRKKWKEQIKTSSFRKFKGTNTKDLMDEDRDVSKNENNDDEFVIEDNDDENEQEEIRDLEENHFEKTKVNFNLKYFSNFTRLMGIFFSP